MMGWTQTVFFFFGQKKRTTRCSSLLEKKHKLDRITADRCKTSRKVHLNDNGTESLLSASPRSHSDHHSGMPQILCLSKSV